MGGLLDVLGRCWSLGTGIGLQLMKRNHDQIVTEDDRFSKAGSGGSAHSATGESRPTTVAMTDKPVQIG